ncbi:MAG: glycosyltransferase family 2 protein [Nostocaceae cyanobacterium]|nr:glycosyltransferase family 2 protein [Nostocaceae cyanobacterium]
MAPVVSLIMTAYNTEAYVGKAIESALGQTCKNIELIVVDNGSTDATGEILNSFNDERLKVLVNEKNQGVGPALNRALREAKGKWVGILDSDDWMAPERLERMVQVAEAEGAEIIADDVYLIRDGEQSPWSTLIRQSGETIERFVEIDPVYFVETDVYGTRCLHLGLTKPLAKREFLLQHGIEYDETLRVILDFWFDMECLLRGAKFVLIPEPYYFYRSRSGSEVVSQDRVEHLNLCCQAIERVLQKDIVKNNRELERALNRHLANYRRNRDYLSVVGPIKRREALVAVQQMLKHPYFFRRFLVEIPAIVKRRIGYYILGNKTVYDMLPQQTDMWSALAEKFQFRNRRVV